MKRPLVLIGHSMGGILARAQIIGLTPEKAEQMRPGVAKLAQASLVRRSLIFEPRSNVKRVIFICTPHWGSRLATSGIAGLGIRLILLPSWIVDELPDFAHVRFADGRLPTSIHGLSPDSRFLQALNRARATSPSHSIIGEHDDVAPASSAGLESALSEIAVPAGYGAFAHPKAIQEIKRILLMTEDK